MTLGNKGRAGSAGVLTFFAPKTAQLPGIRANLIEGSRAAH